MIAFAEVLNEDFPVTSNLYLTSLHNNIVSQVIRQRPLRKHLKLGCQGLNIRINADKYKALPDSTGYSGRQIPATLSLSICGADLRQPLRSYVQA